MSEGMMRRTFLHYGLVAGTASMALALGQDSVAEAVQPITLTGGWQSRAGGDAHIPDVTVCREGELVRIGIVVRHVQTVAHHISAIRLYDHQRQELCGMSLHAALSVAEGLFVLRLPPGSVLFAVSDCNLHGLWMKRFSI